MQSPHENPHDGLSSQDEDAPYISVVVAARNDDHGGNLLGRMQVFVDAWIGQAKRHNLSSELIIVEWNPPGDRDRLEKVLRWPRDTGPCRVRIVEVPAEEHSRYRHATALPLYQMIAKNAGIRRARGEFILATNIDIVFSDELVEFLASRRLQRGRMYRIDRHDVMSDVPADGTLEELLAYCRSHVIRLCAREGTFKLTPDGFRKNEPEDITRSRSGIHFGGGWSPVERDESGRPFRWIGNDAEILLRVPPNGAVIALEVEPGPGVDHTSQPSQVLDWNGSNVAEWKIVGRTTMKLVLPRAPNDSIQSFRLRVPGGGMAIVHDLRILNFRVYRCDWSEESRPAAAAQPFARAIQQHGPALARLLNSRRESQGVSRMLLQGFSVLRRALHLLRTRGDDIFGGGMEFWLGAGWYRLEHAAGEKFRWASHDAHLLVRTTVNRKLALLLEPGPGVGFQPFTLVVRHLGGEVLARTPINGLTYVEVPIGAPKGKITTLILTLEGGGLPDAEDPRILNFRVLACGGGAEDASVESAGESERWTPLTVASRPAEMDWGASLAQWREQIAEMGKQVFLHLNGCGDFTLMAREHWYDVRAYAELDLFSMHLDALLCQTAHCAGAQEEILPEPMRIYHIEHGSGWTPEGQERLNVRLAQKGIQSVSYDDVLWAVALMRSLHGPLIFNLNNWGLAESCLSETGAARATDMSGFARRGLEAMPTHPEDGEPYISVVVAARNDDHGGNMLGRMQAFIDSWMGLSQQYKLSSEIIVVEWNPPANRPRLRDLLRWPAGPQACQVRFIEVSPELHWRFKNPDAIPLHQMIAKNAGIRRARGEFVLATNLDIVFSAELIRFLAERRLERNTLYRMDRHDVAGAIPAQSTVQELLGFCTRNVLRVFRSEGAFELASDGLPIQEEKDIVPPDSGIRLGWGWYPVESYSRGMLRWTGNGAEIFIQRPPGNASHLLIDAETGPSAGGEPVAIEVVDPAGTLLASARVEGRCQLRLHIPEHISSAALSLRVYSRGLPLTRDSRFLNLCVFGMRWDSPESLAKPDWIARRVRIAFNPEPESRLESFEINLTDAAANVIFHATTEQIRTLGVGEHVVTLDLGFQPRTEPAWLLEVTNNVEAATGWAYSQEAVSPFARHMRRPAFLHSNACGDFTLLARDDWYAMRGYAEFPIWPMHLDTLLCYAAHHAGLHEVVLREPMRLFHIEHSSGAGWTPEGETARSARIQSKGVDVVANSEFIGWIHQMRKFNAPMIFAPGNWGLAEVPLPETIV